MSGDGVNFHGKSMTNSPYRPLPIGDRKRRRLQAPVASLESSRRPERLGAPGKCKRRP
jgi:hypothetical protein